MVREPVRSDDAASVNALRGVLDTLPVGIAVFDPRGAPLHVNRLGRDILGDLASLPLDRWLERPRVTHGDGRAISEEELPPVATLRDQAPRRDVELRILRPDGIPVSAVFSAEAVLEPDGTIRHVACAMTPISLVKQRADSARHQAKLDTVATVARSLAGPFNDVLTAISGYCELAMGRLERSHPVRHVVAEIQQAGERAAMLTGRLLAHGEREVPQPEVLELDAWLARHQTRIRSLLGDHITVEARAGSEGVHARVDPHLLEQVVANLVTNAREVMEAGGRLELATRRLDIDPGLAPLLGAEEAGEYAVVSVSDTGGGMSERVLHHAFEPFFTTRSGALGLGLPTVDRLVRSQGGFVRIENRWGQGVTFHVHFPAVPAPEAVSAAEDAEASDARPGARILLVEDDVVVRDLVHEVLEMEHFTVFEAHSTEEAQEVLEREGASLDLVISDVVLPGEGGDVMVRKLRRSYPDLPVLLMSGCSDADRVAQAIEGGATRFLPKPFGPDAMIAKVREVLATVAAA